MAGVMQDMYDIQLMEQKLKGMLSQQRWEHSIRVMEEAVKLARRLNTDIHKTAVAGLLHDCARDMDYRELLIKAREFGIIIDNVTLNTPSIIHAVVGPEIARSEFGVTHPDILNAIRYHTTGRDNMSALEKIIFIADVVEPSRSFPGVDRIRKALYDSIDEAILLSLDSTINYLINKKQLIHLDTIKARNYLLINGR